MDANQRWDVDEAINYMKELAKFKPIWIEEPTSPDDVLGNLPSLVGFAVTLFYISCHVVLCN